ncbi:3'-5' exonuclease [Marinomonas sp. 15G1-11]|uniref:3'-5' exonuclease n=1 Tax=Marinomonas phaeophyticola TaxID=3004091 RepID=A0ABT4JUH0_9GAMM|nr:3'-5' exonuclease [Marinomonas sp. 15G1-11]MCZ2722034.1 3'-5' exonuclease [Marinomonas sp. 15G1-11]
MIFNKKPAPSLLDWKQSFQTLEKNAPQGPLKRFYEQGAVAYDTPLRDTSMVSLDLETTGLNPEKDAIVSAGLVPLNHQRIQCRGSKYWMFTPDSPLSHKSVTIHEMTHEDLNGAPSLEDCFEEVLAALAKKVVIVHCVHIEREFLLKASLKLYGQPLYFPILDTMEIENRILKQRSWIEKLKQGRISIRLDACRQRYNLPRYKAHHALTDAYSSAELLQAQMAHHLDEDQPISNYWL